MRVIKRSGEEVEFERIKIENAVRKANKACPFEEERLTELQIAVIGEYVEDRLNKLTHTPNIEEIQDLVIKAIMRQNAYTVAQLYTEYRYKRALIRKSNTTDDAIMSLVNFSNEDLKQENSNKNPVRASTQRDYIAGEVSKDMTNRLLLTEEITEAHKKGIIHFHDSDYFIAKIHNCDLVNLDDMLQNGTVITDTMIEKPNSFSTACNIATQIVAQVASNQYGGQTITLSHLAPFVDVSRRKWVRKLTADFNDAGVDVSEDAIKQMAELRLKDEIKSGIQTIQYQLLTLMTTNGQTPFVTVFMYIDEVEEGQTREDLVLLIREMLEQRIQGIKNEEGIYITPAFPKLIYVLDEDNIYPTSKYKGVGNVPRAKNYVEGRHRYYGRFNQGVVTINLVDVACSSNKDMEKFWQILDDRLELCHRALQIRHKRLLGTPSDIAPILWQYGALARLNKGETIDKLLYDGYSTISLGYAGVYEMTRYMTGESHTEENGKKFALAVMEELNRKCMEWRKAENIHYSLYGTPMESTTYKFAKCLQERFGSIPEVTDHNYITNSYHICVRENIDAFDKLSKEAEFQRLSPGGAISYVEVPDMQNNIDAVLSLMQHIYNTIMYAELNTKSDYCQVCGYDGEISLVKDEHNKLIWKCPKCGNTDQDKMNVARRTCGYIGTQFWNQGRTQEIKDRVLHL